MNQAVISRIADAIAFDEGYFKEGSRPRRLNERSHAVICKKSKDNEKNEGGVYFSSFESLLIVKGVSFSSTRGMQVTEAWGAAFAIRNDSCAQERPRSWEF